MTFSLALSDEQQQLRYWAHEFSLKVIRPAAFDWDDREETPWPILQEAAGIGLYGHDILMTLLEDATGQGFPILAEKIRYHLERVFRERKHARCRWHHRFRHRRADRALGAAVLWHRQGRQGGRVLFVRARGRLRCGEHADHGQI